MNRVIVRTVGLFHYEEDESAQKLFFSETSHALHVLEALNEQRRQRVLCDVIICVEDKEFACHRSVLAAGSPYFFTMFSSKSPEIGLIYAMLWYRYNNDFFLFRLSHQVSSQRISHTLRANTKYSSLPLTTCVSSFFTNTNIYTAFLSVFFSLEAASPLPHCPYIPDVSHDRKPSLP